MNVARLPATAKTPWSRRRFALALPLLLGAPHWGQASAASPGAPGASGAVARQSRHLMGTRVDIAVPLSGDMLQRDADAAMMRAFAEMQRLEGLMSRYRPDSEVARIGAAAGRAAVAVSPEVLAVLRAARQLHRDSGGAFDPTVGALQGWRFEASARAIPAPAEIERALQLVDGQGLELDERASTARLVRPGMQLDLGGVAKLPILQAGLRVLTQAGVADALVNGGGDVLIAGAQHGQAWRIGVRDPAAPERLLGVVAMRGLAVVASSGDYERGFLHEGRLLHHVLNPRTGWPTQGVHGVALVASTVEQVNGWGATLMVQGPQAAATWSARHPAVDVLMVGTRGARFASAGMTARLAEAA